MTETEYTAAKFSFSRVPESCPEVQTVFDEFLQKHPQTKEVEQALQKVIDFAKSRNEKLRELTFILGRQAIEGGVALR